MHRPCGNVARVTWVVRNPLGPKDERYRAFEHKYARVEVVGMRRGMPVRFNFALANLITLLSQTGFEFRPIHLPVLPLENADTLS